MPADPGHEFLWSQVIAFVAVGVLALVLRWAWTSRSTSLLSRRPRSGPVTDYGLLVPVAEPGDLAEGRRLAARLETAGVRSTLTTTQAGLRLMVFPDDAERARSTLGDAPG